MNNPSLRILIADDHDLIRRGVKVLLEDRPRWELCGEAITGEEAVAKCEELKPDIAILDFSMPKMNGLAAAKKIRDISPSTSIVMLTVDCSEQLIREMFAFGVQAYVQKNECEAQLIKAIESVEAGRPHIPASALDILLTSSSFRHQDRRLTKEQGELVGLIAGGKTSGEIASHLGTSKKIVEGQRARIMAQLKIHSVSDLVRYAIRNGISIP
jgi:DNA-binding NarL/FixJ family response regulator